MSISQVSIGAEWSKTFALLQGDTELQTMTWGLVPSWTKKEERLDFFRMFNARCETVPEKTVFSRLLGSKRCVVLLNGFFEWAQVSYHQITIPNPKHHCIFFSIFFPCL